MMKHVNTYWTIPSPEKTVFWRWRSAYPCLMWIQPRSIGCILAEMQTRKPLFPGSAGMKNRLGDAGMVQPRFFMCMEQPNSNHSQVFSYLCTMMNDVWKVQMPVSTSIIPWNDIQFPDPLDLWLLIHKDLWSIVPWSRLESSIRSVCPTGFSGFSHLHWASWSLWTRYQARDESIQPAPPHPPGAVPRISWIWSSISWDRRTRRTTTGFFLYFFWCSQGIEMAVNGWLMDG